MSSTLHPVGVPTPTGQTLEQFRKDLHQAVQHSLPIGRKPYKKVFLVQLLWDNLGIDYPELKSSGEALEKLFCTDYNYVYRQFCFRQVKAPKKTMQHAAIELTNLCLRDCNDKDTLIVFHYIGHSHMSKNDCILDSDAFLVQTYKTQNTLNFSNLIKMTLEITEADVLYIMDCCYAAEAGLSCNKELLAASSMKETATAIINGNFTRKLCDALVENQRAPITAAQLHGKLFKYFDSKQVGLHRLPYRGQYRLPYHAELHPQMPGSIVLAPLFSASSTQVNAQDLHSSKVIITATISSGPNLPNVLQWQKYLTTNLPSDVKNLDIEVTSVHQGSSFMMMVALPVSVWAAMRSDPAYCKVPSTPINSGNLLLQAQTPSQQPLSMRPKSPDDLENIKPGSSEPQ